MRAAIWGRVRLGLKWLSFRHLPTSQRRVARIGLVVLILAPLALFGVSAIHDYIDIRQLGTDGMNHILHVKDLFLNASANVDSCGSGSASGGTSSTSISLSSLNSKALTNQKTLQQAYNEFMAARSDFLQVNNDLNNQSILLGLGSLLPGYGKEISAAKKVAQAGLDIANLGAEVTNTALAIVKKLPADPLSSGTAPLITKDEIPLIQKTVKDADQLVADLQTQLTNVSASDLPISACQRALFNKAIGLLPEAHHLMDEANTYLPAAIWALGIDQPRNFLVQTLDRAELRASGGFAGQYGVVNITGARVGSLTLQDIAWLDYCGTGTCAAIGNPTPAKWSSWWPFPNFGLRDSNISADFPTTAQLAINLFAKEGGGNVDGVIQLTPIPIEHILSITGPIFVPGYDETITSQNLEDRLHYYQQDPAGIAKEKIISADNTTITARKRFTALVGSLLQQKVRQLPLDQLMQVAKSALADLRSKDLEVYFSDPQAEALLTQYGLDASLSRGSSPDTWMLVQSNDTGSKASQYVITSQTDVVNLDADGGATHHLTISFDYNKQGDVYGYPTYRDYIRIYAPAGSQLISGSGFDSGKAMCLPQPPPGSKLYPPWSVPWSQYQHLPQCSYTNPYPDGGMSCPAGGWANNRPFSLEYYDVDALTPWPLDYLSGPTNTKSDEPGLAMFGGILTIPPYCTATVTLTWHTPKVAAPGVAAKPGQSPYSLLVQRQSGTFNALNVTIIPDPKAAGSQGKQQVIFKGTLGANQLITLKPVT
jgi:hypothetical protein